MFTRVHALWSRAFAGERLESVIRKPSRPTLASALGVREAELASPELVERQAAIAHVASLIKIQKCLESELGLFYECLIGRHYLENLRIVLRGRLSGLPAPSVQDLILRVPGLPVLNVEKLLLTTRGADVSKLLPPHQFTKALSSLFTSLDGGKNLFEVESEMDRIFYEQCMAAACALGEPEASCAVDLLQREILAVNVLTVLRNLTTYKLPPEQIQNCLVPMSGILSARDFAGLARVTKAEQIADCLQREYRERMAEVLWTDVRAVESAFWRVLYDKARGAFCNFFKPELSIVAFPFVKRFELANIRMAVEALRLGLSDTDLAQHLGGGAYV